MIRAISEGEFEQIISSTFESAHLSILLNSKAVNWLASDDRTTAGVVHRDRDGTQISYSWGAYRDGECVAFAIEALSEYDAIIACMRAMVER